SLIPSIIGRTATTIDPRARIPEDIFEKIKTRLPFTDKKGIAIRRDIFGEAVLVTGGRFNLIDPFTLTRDTKDPVLAEATRVGVVIGMPSKTMSGVKLTEAEYSLFQKLQGKALKIFLKQLIESKEYKSRSIVDQEKTMQKVIRDVRNEARDTMFPALMVKRFNLPENINPELLRGLLIGFSQETEFQKLSDEKKGKVLRKALKLDVFKEVAGQE
ncbi:hypothetical protein LCGC14_1825180, partial [marine sediment metagenome]